MPSSRESKRQRPRTLIREILAKNVSELRDRVYLDIPTVTGRNRALAEKIGTRLSQIQRICCGKLGTSIDTVEWLAAALAASCRLAAAKPRVSFPREKQSSGDATQKVRTLFAWRKTPRALGVDARLARFHTSSSRLGL
jgi:hypothetical protein